MVAVYFSGRDQLSELATPGMITPEEERLYYHLARSYWDPQLTYLEVGTWLGRSTTRICQGLESAAPQSWRLFCYDAFVWRADHMPKAARQGMPPEVARLREGDSFREAFLSLMGSFGDRITTVQGMVQDAPLLLAEALPARAKLGVLFVDASKGWENAQLLRAVAPHLTTDTRIVFQDFFINSAITLQALLMWLPLEAELVVSDGGSIVFRVAQEIPPNHALFQKDSFKKIDEKAIRRACERLREVVPSPKYEDAGMALTLPALLWRRGYHEQANQAAESLALSTEQCRVISRRLEQRAAINIPPIVARLKRGLGLEQAQSDLPPSPSA